jgi:glycosyltransferase involved in cell wall biosynthesis
MRPMLSNVLLVTNEYPPEKTAGTAMATQFLAEELASRGVRVTVVVNTRETAPAKEANGGLDVIRLRPLPVPATRMAQRAVLLARIAGRIHPDIIQGQSLSCGALAAFAGRLLGIPSVVYVQGLDLYESSPWARRTYVRWALARCDAVVAVTEDLRRRAQALSGRDPVVIPHGLKHRAAHGIDRATARLQLGLPADRPIVLFVGRLIPLKGIIYLIRAFSAVREGFPDAMLVIVGEGEQRPDLEALAAGLGLGTSVIFAGGQPHEDVIRLMRGADLFVLPSLIESFGIVLLEAMSCGLPIVASNVMGIPSIVTDAVNGFLVPPGDETALGTRIAELLADPQRRAVMAAANVLRAEEYALPAIADRFIDVWNRVARNARNGAQCVRERDA